MTTHVLVLTSDTNEIAARILAIAVTALAEAGLEARPFASPPGPAREIALRIAEPVPPPALLARVRAALATAGHQVDANIVALAHRRKRLLVADMESTIIEQEMLDELADAVGERARVADITLRAMRGEMDFEAAITQRVALLAGLDAGMLQRIYDERVTLMPRAQALIATMKAHGATCALVSGGFTFFTERVAARLGFDLHRANTLEIANGHLTGRVVPPILGREAKLATLRELATKHGFDLAETLAVGDGANDLDMLSAAGLGVAFRAKPDVQAEMAACPTGAVVTHGDLTALLHLQGLIAS